MNLFDMKTIIQIKIDIINKIFVKLEHNNKLTILDFLNNELQELNQLIEQFIKKKENKVVIKSEDHFDKTRFYLKDGSIYVVTKKYDKNYKYLYDVDTKIMTYMFETGQIERTFENGLKEIRMPDGKIYIKHGPADYDDIKSNIN